MQSMLHVRCEILPCHWQNSPEADIVLILEIKQYLSLDYDLSEEAESK